MIVATLVANLFLAKFTLTFNQNFLVNILPKMLKTIFFYSHFELSSVVHKVYIHARFMLLFSDLTMEGFHGFEVICHMFCRQTLSVISLWKGFIACCKVI